MVENNTKCLIRNDINMNFLLRYQLAMSPNETFCKNFNHCWPSLFVVGKLSLLILVLCREQGSKSFMICLLLFQLFMGSFSGLDD